MSNAVIKDTLLLVAPEFASRTSDALELMINLTKHQVSEAVFKESYIMAVALLTAHRFSVASNDSVDTGGGTAVVKGPLIAEREGELERKYAAVTVSSGAGAPTALSSTPYGLLFSELKRSYIFAPMLGG